MVSNIEEILQSAKIAISECDTTFDLQTKKVAFLGKNGYITNLLKGLKDLQGEEKAKAGKLLNDTRVTLENNFDTAYNVLHKKEIDKKLAENAIDVSIDRDTFLKGAMHPLNIVNKRIVDFFVSLGFSIEDSPEIETDYYNFEALNIPKDHPARGMQDTFFITENILLRSQTSNGQIRTMKSKDMPIKMLSPGRVYRADDVDATHSPVFHQIEGLVVDEGITMCDLKGVLELFAKYIFGKNTNIRFRQSFFPFTEPSVEVDASCSSCGGSGCRICKWQGYIEILGAGMVHRNVLNECGIDKKYTGFAFGMGLERMTNIIYNITDMRLLYENDIRFLKQFSI